MPELPEVENVRRGLAELVIGKTVKDIQILWSKIVVNPDEVFLDGLVDRQIIGVDRRGKYLLIRFDHDLTVVSHLRMEGKYEVDDQSAPVTKHTHVIFEMTDGTQLRYLDTRKFGRMQLIETGQEMTVAGLKTLGPEPTPATFDVHQFYQALQKHHKAIKPLLLDQKVVSGLGNIYVDETLWLSQIHPETPADLLTQAEVQKLHDDIITELQLAINSGGTTVNTFLNATGHAGAFQEMLHVYGKKGEPCERCQTPIEKIKVAQRGTHFCPHCQIRKEAR
ncbi:DNA-formamidopyrimidine glycosylase [Latilactobacillus fuchuensis]|uniref:Formamidopyrimidine-DNA glycosylase n=2 Tax=Latilactobacillus fuchuensis TaxID=164393 RepID=A0A2N9DWQ0_9LACO|nr:DNA-formamidopyrimidine glycosylase [Latilactobacillus fuchuensis]KRL61363.1 formamidopyrimidine-DNA glycosylase [Latilactobacillus fuchuensis DSM 14340 = JCM 11249]SPC39102.1 formamidopyrimidine-DNA glycosylase [Latilactobacillus fuchuensis]